MNYWMRKPKTLDEQSDTDMIFAKMPTEISKNETLNISPPPVRIFITKAYTRGQTRAPSKGHFTEQAEILHEKRLSNAEFYINTYLLYEDACDFTQGVWEIDDYLGYFYIRKCMWSTPGNIKSTAASFKKFYQCMLKHEMIQKSDYEYLCETIKENMWKWQSDCEIYNDPDAENPFFLF